ncbi:mediator of RNA polymerase II transcription subunit 22 isoform X1 [Panthera onca]|uniref:mediator of RNA polymerase II transcription subunit 22 isoform X1 n=1 Tax=Panthera onca TaxID=9690 RepID=UPI0029546D8D|nr:mediator of RNA polymerase II transcription subunit 22 isoform X1 [Panthera onca]XP_060466351.1 mediator of RNA polymerase II transcription subunit 22 isoform X1 [Panthera onca]
MAQQRALPQSKETLLQSYNKRLKDDIKSIMDNFTEIIKTAKIEDETQVSRATQGEQDNYEMHVRAANIVRAGESLMKLVSDLKQFLILNDFPSVNEAIDQRNQQLRALQEECDRKLIALRDEISIDLYELEEEYYSSRNNLYLTLTKKKGLQPMEHVWGKGRRSGPNLTGVSTVFSVMTPEQQALCTISVLFSWAEATVPIGNGKRSGFSPPTPEQGSSPPPPPL